jgi:enoyl-CoA hydratase/carnithine racemase
MSPFRGSVPLTEDWRHFRFEVADGIATVTLDRPGKLNALTFETYADLRDLLAQLPSRGDARVLVLRGTGRAFCSGGDVNEIIGATLAMDAAGRLAFTRMTGEVVRAMRECPLPIIVALQGMAAGAGSVLALAADFRIATPDARFAFLFTKVGLSGADMGAAYLLPRLVGLGHATRLLMLGDTITADDAERIGLISQLVCTEALDEAVAALARRLADGPVQAYAQTKSLLTREQDMSLSAALELDATTQALLMTGADYAEFHAAFTEGRAPRWTGRLLHCGAPGGCSM